MVEDDRYDTLMAKKKKARLTKFGDVAGGLNLRLHEEAGKRDKAKGARHRAQGKRTR
jgi:hypothetical protein